jgi:acyl-coenzyme A synthetase/AMP-(fatty) acid ligase
MAAWHVGGCVVFDLRPNALDEFFELGITKASLLPPMCKEFLTAGARRRPAIDCSDLELNVMSGFLSLDVAQQIVRAITPRLYITYSATELVQVPMQSHFRAQEDLDWLAVSDGSTVEVVDDHNAPCPVGSEGYVRIRLADVDCKGYLENADATARAFRRGWFYSGDMAVRREDGRVRILGRVADVINLHGQKSMVAPIEQSLQRRLAAEEVCLFVHLNERGQEELLVAVQSPHPLEPAKIEMIRNQFSDFDSVKIQVLAQFPRTTTGTLKVRRAALKNQIKSIA